MKSCKYFSRYISLAIVLSALYGCGDSAEVKMVKGGSLQSCPNATIEKMVNGFMGSPKWESGKGENGQVFVNIRGDITLHDKPVRALVQFFIDKNAGSFQFNAFETNDVPQPNLMALGLLSKMCESASK